MPFADRCLLWLEITDLFGRLRYKELCSHFLLHNTEQGKCISGQLILFLPLILLLPITASSRRKNRRILSEDPCRLSHFLSPLIYCSQIIFECGELSPELLGRTGLPVEGFPG